MCAGDREERWGYRQLRLANREMLMTATQGLETRASGVMLKSQDGASDLSMDDG